MDTSPASGSETPATSIDVSRSAVTVLMRRELSFETWREIRDAREIARERSIPLRIDMQGCPGSTMGGIATLFIARERLGVISLYNCPDRIAYFFDGLGVCGQCANNLDPGCLYKRARLKGKPVSEFSG